MNVRRFEQRYRPARSLGLLNQLLQDADFGATPAVSAEPDSIADWVPAVDIREKTDCFILTADLPGVDPENIEVTMDDGVLTIQGSRTSETSEDHSNYQRYERANGKFLRRFSLPDTADGESISAESRLGVLAVSIPKQEKPEARKISVKPA